MSGFEFDAPKSVSTNRVARVDCKTCGGDRMVVYSRRTAEASGWQQARGLKAKGEYEEYVPCPACNADANTKREDFRSPNPPQVRARLGK